ALYARVVRDMLGKTYVELFFTSSRSRLGCFSFFFNDTPTTELYTLSLHDALPIYGRVIDGQGRRNAIQHLWQQVRAREVRQGRRSEEHTSELQSRGHLVCRLLLEKKKHRLMRVAG